MLKIFFLLTLYLQTILNWFN